MSVSASQSQLHAYLVRVLDSAVRSSVTLSVEALVNLSFYGAPSYFILRPKQYLENVLVLRKSATRPTVTAPVKTLKDVSSGK